MNHLKKHTRRICNKKPPSQLLPLGAMILAGLTNSHAVNAQEMADKKEKQLPTVTVQAEADRPEGYRATTTRVGKVLQDPHDIPQAVRPASPRI